MKTVITDSAFALLTLDEQNLYQRNEMLCPYLSDEDAYADGGIMGYSTYWDGYILKTWANRY